MNHYTSNIPQKQCIGTCQRFLDATPDNFPKDKDKPDGLRSKCKDCTKEYKKQHYQDNKSQILQHNKQYRDGNRDKVYKRKKEYYDENREHILEQTKKRNAPRKEDKKEYDKQYRDKNKDRITKNKRIYEKENEKRISRHRRQYYESHLEEYRERRKQYLQSEHGRRVRRASEYKRLARKKGTGGSCTAAQLQESVETTEVKMLLVWRQARQRQRNATCRSYRPSVPWRFQRYIQPRDSVSNVQPEKA